MAFEVLGEPDVPEYGGPDQVCEFYEGRTKRERERESFPRRRQTSHIHIHTGYPYFKDKGEEFIEFELDSAIFITGIEIFETFNPGFVTKVHATQRIGDVDPTWDVLWEGREPAHPPGKLVKFSPQLCKLAKPFQFVRVYIDTSIVKGCEFSFRGRDGGYT